MKIVYIAHPIGGDIEANLTDLRRILRHINLTYPDVVPLAPYYGDVVSLNDSLPEERERGINNGVTLLYAGFIEEMWLTGEGVSKGMYNEVEIANKIGIAVFNYIKLF